MEAVLFDVVIKMLLQTYRNNVIMSSMFVYRKSLHFE